ncbi:two-component regulator propeller domain-containing protein [Ignavibacterium sp.]|uniref:hybrid sensor histidine kinase/response regulator transcription factor n=1 Tax=Ignavibacterium sp. TaxID=2651167 RepID=UPI00307F153D
MERLRKLYNFIWHKLINMMLKKSLQLLLFINFILYSQSIEFRNYSVQYGLSNNSVNCVIQDNQGFIWFGSEDGLNRFDGYEFKVFRPSPKKNSISAKDIWSLYQDNNGNIWIGTKSGDINKLDIKTRKFSHWKIEEKKLNDNSITAIYVDGEKNVWVGTYQQGLFKFNKDGKRIAHWEFNPDSINGISNNFITSIIEDQNGKIWIGTYFGLNEFNPKEPQKGFVKFISSDKSISNNLIWELRLSEIEKNKLWICKASGLSNIDVNSKKISVINIPIESSIQFSGSVSDVAENIEDGKLVLYVGTYGGLVRLDMQSGNFKRFIQDENNPKSIINNQINQLIKDKSGVIWFATENGISSLSIKYNFHSSTEKFISENLKVFNFDVKTTELNNSESVFVGTSKGLYNFNLKSLSEQKISQVGDLNIWSLLKDNDQLWIGTYGQGLFNFNLKSKQLRKIKIEYPLFQTQAYNFIKSITDDSKGNLYIGTWGGGLIRLEKKTNKIQFWRSDKNLKGSISFNDVWSGLVDKSGRIWLGTNGGGLNYFNPEKNTFVSLTTENSRGHLKSNSILHITESYSSSAGKNDNTILWICHDYGLTKLILKNTTDFSEIDDIILSSKTYTAEDGLTSEVVNSVVEDENGNLWVSTSNGIFTYDKSISRFNRLPYYLERKHLDYSAGASLNFYNKTYLFGSNEGLKIFTASDINPSQFKPKVSISDFQLFNKSLFDDPEQLETVFNNRKINLSYSQNVFSFSFTSTDFNNPGSTKYAFMLKGFDKNWNYTDDRRFVTYTNLNPGEYEFLVKATNSDGVWNDEPTSLMVVVNPPWWRTPWAYAGFILLFLGGILMIRRLELNKAKLLNDLKMKEFEAEKLREVEAMKSRFFANISHELRTPLMLIQGPIEAIIQKASNEVVDLANLASKSSSKLKLLIDQLLELTQLDSAKILVKATKDDIVLFARNIFYEFKSAAEAKEISLKFETEVEQIYCWFDKDILEKILSNLLSNALKFTNRNGLITLSMKVNNIHGAESVIIAVSDTGIGIDENELEKVFDRFYQASDSVKKNYSGFGIGLSLIKEFIDLHRWKIEVKSKKGVGSDFFVTIPLSDGYLDENQKITIKEIIEPDKKTEFKVSQEISTEQIANVIDKQNDKPLILIVEDSEDVRYFISTLLKNEFRLTLAVNGQDAIEKSLEELPDLILSDIMMPEMDGLELCRRLKSDWKTSHIPVILLTAKIATEDKLDGLELGADDYITKPFNPKELIVRIKNLLKQRRLLKEKFSKTLEIKPEEIADKQVDSEFINRAIEIVEKNIYDLNFNTERFAEEMFLSRSQLHRKLNSLTNQSPGEFIRTVKLKKAAALLIEKKLSVTQIALEIGFNSPSHFTKAFKQMFDCLPSEFVAKQTKSR